VRGADGNIGRPRVRAERVGRGIEGIGGIPSAATSEAENGDQEGKGKESGVLHADTSPRRRSADAAGRESSQPNTAFRAGSTESSDDMKKLLLLCALAVLIAGCAEVPEDAPPGDPATGPISGPMSGAAYGGGAGIAPVGPSILNEPENRPY
jgi:hypothetical protein